MTRAALDSNILIYAELEPQSAKGQLCADLIIRVAADGVIPVQVLGEYLRVVQRRAPQAFPAAVAQADLYKATFYTPATTERVMAEAAAMAVAHHLQLWDCVVCAAAAEAGAKVLLSEDLQDGRMLGGLRVINPLNPANQAQIDALMSVP